jgi:thiamine-phosphate pyrophosphorylase
MALVPTAEAGLRAGERGATILQLRDPAAAVATLEREAGRLVAAATVPVVISGRVDVALAAGAAGVHLPEADLPVGEARKLLPESLLGRSVHSLRAAQSAEAAGADYVVFGPVFETASHPGQGAIGLERLREVTAALGIPVLAIGGVDATTAELCRAAGAAGFAAIRYFSETPRWST